jgi:hypothetical protein
MLLDDEQAGGSAADGELFVALDLRRRDLDSLDALVGSKPLDELIDGAGRALGVNPKPAGLVVQPNPAGQRQCLAA